MKTNNRLFLDIHVIQTMPPSNINRDDVGSPKTAQYGGVLRSRVSSQSWKRAIRTHFNNNFDSDVLGIRTKDLSKVLLEEYDELSKMSEGLTKKDFKKKSDKVQKTLSSSEQNKKDVLLFIGNKQLKRVAKLLYDSKDIDEENDKNIKEQKQEELKQKIREALKIPALDIALFGRMMATKPMYNVDASAQVAHAISTHEVNNEFDYFTALDDYKIMDESAEDKGAGFLDSTEFNSSTLYRYANVAIHELKNQLNDDEILMEGLKIFVKSFVESVPTGKINSFANQTIPQAILISLRNDRPVSLVSAYENPIKSSREGYTLKSIQELLNEKQKVEKILPESVKSFFVTTSDPDKIKIEKMLIHENFAELLKDFLAEIKNHLNAIG